MGNGSRRRPYGRACTCELNLFNRLTSQKNDLKCIRIQHCQGCLSLQFIIQEPLLFFVGVTQIIKHLVCEAENEPIHGANELHKPGSAGSNISFSIGVHEKSKPLLPGPTIMGHPCILFLQLLPAPPSNM